MGQDNFDIGEAKKLLKCTCGCLDFDIEKVKWRAPPLQQAPVYFHVLNRVEILY